MSNVQLERDRVSNISSDLVRCVSERVVLSNDDGERISLCGGSESENASTVHRPFAVHPGVLKSSKEGKGHSQIDNAAEVM